MSSDNGVASVESILISGFWFSAGGFLPVVRQSINCAVAPICPSGLQYQQEKMISRAVQKNNDSASDVTDSDSFLERTAWMKLGRWIISVITMFYLLSFLVRSFQ
jgi:hypothetical protein